MYLSYVFLTWEGEVLGFNDSPVYVLSLHFSHFLFIEDAQVLTDELGVDSDDLNQLVPELEDLATY